MWLGVWRGPPDGPAPVSNTHLDVYKRQGPRRPPGYKACLLYTSSHSLHATAKIRRNG
ncbi:hypothetical protein [Arthrobacter sp. KBS0703]|uniref:hypothetical protein n=1 Tax=Arthrobacter sp. KBS0703 TaxID=1955698 RepID=UPI00163D4E27|nr:hypothetical protein [Arthrobacter sp. KBS0703]